MSLIQHLDWGSEVPLSLIIHNTLGKRWIVNLMEEKLNEENIMKV